MHAFANVRIQIDNEQEKKPNCPTIPRPVNDVVRDAIYRVVQKTDTQFYFWDNFGNSAPILTILLLLQAEIYGA